MIDRRANRLTPTDGPHPLAQSPGELTNMWVLRRTFGHRALPVGSSRLSAAAGPRCGESLGRRADVFGDLLLAIEFLPPALNFFGCKSQPRNRGSADVLALGEFLERGPLSARRRLTPGPRPTQSPNLAAADRGSSPR